MNDDMTYSEAKRDYEREKYERKQEAWKAQIIGSPVEMEMVIGSASDVTQMEIMRAIATLTDMGLELPNPNHAPILKEQALDVVQELAQAVKQAIEEYISE